MIEEATNGRVKVTIFPGNTLVPQPEQYRAVQEGICDVLWVYQSYAPGAMPTSDLFMLPGLFPNMATSNVVLNMLFAEFPAFTDEMSPKVKHIASQVMLRADLHSTHPIRNLDDLQGKIIGCQDEMSARALSLAGASTSTMTLDEMYTAGERGMVDGIVVAWGAFFVWKLYEVYDYHTVLGLSPVPSHWMFNRDTWNKFTPDEQQKLELLGPWFQRAINEAAGMPGMLARGTEVTPDKGHEIIEWSTEDMNELRETFKPIWDKWVEDMEAKGIPGNDILKRALQLLDSYGYRFG